MTVKKKFLFTILSMLFFIVAFAFPVHPPWPPGNVSISASAEAPNMRVWVSDTEYGDVPAIFRKGRSYYLCYELTDPATGKRLTDSNIGCEAEMTIYKPDGSVAHTKSYTDFTDSWISYKMDTVGKWSGTVTLSGNYTSEISVTWDVTEITLNVWISDNKYGSIPDSFTEGVRYYLCYELRDADNNVITDKLTGYNVHSVMYAPDGSEAYSYDFTDLPNCWISYPMTSIGEWKGCVSVTGEINVDETIVSWDVEKESSAPDVTLKAWLSDSPAGAEVTNCYAGSKYYLCYEIIDNSTGKLLDSSITGYQSKLTIFQPDGEVGHTADYTDFTDSWIGCRMNAVGTWKGVVTFTGEISGECNVSWDIKDASAIENLSLHTWVSKTDMGEEAAVIKPAEGFYLCYELIDDSTGQRASGNLSDYVLKYNIDGFTTSVDVSGSSKTAAGRSFYLTKSNFDLMSYAILDISGGYSLSGFTTWTNIGSPSTPQVTTVATGDATPKATTTTTTTTTPTTTPVVIPENVVFNMGQDNWGFTNSNDVFTSGTYQMNDKYKEALMSGLTNTERERIKKAFQEPWGGSCYGMASTAILSSYGILNPADYQSGAKYLSGISSLSEEVESLINYYFMLQFTDKPKQAQYAAVHLSEREKIKNLIEKAQDGHPVLLTFFWLDGSGGHAVVAYDVEYEEYTIDGYTFDGRVLIYDNAYGVFNDDLCLYFNSAKTDWCIPGYGLYSFNEVGTGVLGRVTDELELINYHGYLNANDYDVSRSYIASLTSNNAISDYSFQKIKANSSGWTMNGSLVDDDILTLSSLRDFRDTENHDTQFIMRDATSGYALQLAEQSAQNLSMDYENCLLLAQSSYMSQAVFDPDGYIEIIGKNQAYDLKMVFNEGSMINNWTGLEVTGKNADKASLRQTPDGYVLNAGNLQNIVIQASAGDAEQTMTFSSDYPEVLIYENSAQGIGVKADADNDGVFETEISLDRNLDVVPSAVIEPDSPVNPDPAPTPSPSVNYGLILLIIAGVGMVLLIGILIYSKLFLGK